MKITVTTTSAAKVEIDLDADTSQRILTTGPPINDSDCCLPARPTDNANYTLKYMPGETPKTRWVKD